MELNARAVVQYPRPLENLLPSNCGVESLEKQLSKCGLGTGGILKTPLSRQSVKSNPFHKNSKILFAFFHLAKHFPDTT